MLTAKFWTVSGLAAAALALAGCSSSSPFGSASNTEVTFVNASQTWDLDKNGTTTCDEWKQYASGELRQADSNGDGALDASEWAVMAKTDKLFDTANLGYYDGNGDGKVSADELTGKPNAAFKLLDKNNDCQIAHDEKATVYSNVKVKSKDNASAPPGPGGPGR
jgi:hypothetical protein